MLTAVTRNLGNRTAGRRWLDECLYGERRPDVLFLQEVNQSILHLDIDGYVIVAGRETELGAVGCTSALIINQELAPDPGGQEIAANPLPALGTYAASALVRAESDVWLISAHTSPSRVPPAKMRTDFCVRSCEHDVWWSDAFVADLKAFVTADQPDLLIAGDLNQALAYDRDHPPHRCSSEFLHALRDTGLVDITLRDWLGVERPTRRNPDYHLDRVLASGDMPPRVRVDPEGPVFDHVSDHAAVWFSLQI